MKHISRRTLLILLFRYCTVVCSTYEDVCVDVSDILSAKWMPGTLLQIKNINESDQATNGSMGDINKKGVLKGTITNALDTMAFHRSKMNQYLCRNYVANQIKSELTNNGLKRRMAVLDEETSDEKILQKGKIPSVLFDQGSSAYEDWLQKSATLDDIYRNHQDINSLSIDSKQTGNSEIQQSEKDASISTKVDHDYQGVPGMSDYLTYSGSHYGHKSPVYVTHPVYYGHHTEKDYGKEDKVLDIFEIALTALAYLSFGMFIIHLIMSISAISHNTTTVSNRVLTLNLGLESSNAETYELDNTEAGSGSEEIRYRSVKRSTRSLEAENRVLNEMARRILSTFDAALKIQEDGGQCFRKAICNTTRYSRNINGKNKYLMGLWSFGLCWLSENLSNKTVTKTECLQAILLGLGMTNCDRVYAKC